VASYTPYRFPVKLDGTLLRAQKTAILDVPAGAMFLSVGVAEWRPGEVQTWWMCDTTTADKKRVELMVLGTGHGFVDETLLQRLKFLGTVVCDPNQEVYHVFQVLPQRPRLAMMAEGDVPQRRGAERREEVREAA
jgi:hypothetical protein